MSVITWIDFNILELKLEDIVKKLEGKLFITVGPFIVWEYIYILSKVFVENWKLLLGLSDGAFLIWLILTPKFRLFVPDNKLTVIIFPLRLQVNAYPFKSTQVEIAEGII